MNPLRLPKYSNFTLNPGKTSLTLHAMGWILTILFIAMTFIPRSIDHTLFVDGLAYASIARNMALGQGIFWQPHFADSFWLNFNDRCSFFCEHPPLMFGMQSLLFRAFGDNTYVENIYNFLILILSIIPITLIWSSLFKNNQKARELSWLPVLFWYGMRIVWWSVPNNLLDTTIAVFCLWSCYFQLKAYSSNRAAVFYWLLAAIMILLACLTKGPVGLFPLAFPILYLIAYGKNSLRKSLQGAGIVLISFLFFSVILLMYGQARYFLTNYFQGQVVLALMKKREKINDDWTGHFYLLRLLIINIIPHIIILAGLYFTCFIFKMNTRLCAQTRKGAMLLMLVCLSVVLPMLASAKQADYYLMPVLPFVALLFAALSMEMLSSLADGFYRIKSFAMPVISIILLLITCYQILNPVADYMYEISGRISRHVPPNSKIYLPRRIALFSEIHTPFQRYARLSIAFNPNETDYLFFDDPKDAVLDSVTSAGTHKMIALGYNAVLAVRK